MNSLWYKFIYKKGTDSRFGETFMMIPDKPFAGLSVMTITDKENLYFLNFLIKIV